MAYHNLPDQLILRYENPSITFSEAAIKKLFDDLAASVSVPLMGLPTPDEPEGKQVGVMKDFEVRDGDIYSRNVDIHDEGVIRAIKISNEKRGVGEPQFGVNARISITDEIEKAQEENRPAEEIPQRYFFIHFAQSEYHCASPGMADIESGEGEAHFGGAPLPDTTPDNIGLRLLVAAHQIINFLEGRGGCFMREIENKRVRDSLANYIAEVFAAVMDNRPQAIDWELENEMYYKSEGERIQAVEAFLNDDKTFAEKIARGVYTQILSHIRPLREEVKAANESESFPPITEQPKPLEPPQHLFAGLVCPCGKVPNGSEIVYKDGKWLWTCPNCEAIHKKSEE